MSQPTSAMKGTGKSAITERAITSIQQWPPKGSCIIKGVSTSEFYAATDELQSLCAEYQLTLEFYSKDKVLAFCRMMSPIEASIQPWLATEVQRMQEERFTKPSHWYHRITQNYSMEFKSFNGDHQWSRKAPNVSIQSVGRPMPNLVVEVAFSETREHARRKAHLWLESSNICRVVILVTINESEPPCSMLADVPRIPIPEDYSLCEDDDDWVGDLQVSIEVVRKGADGIYNECELHLVDVTRNELRMAELSRGYESDDSTHDKHAQSSQCPGTPGPDGPKLTIKRSDIYGDRIPRSLGGDDTFGISTDSLRGFMAQYRRDLGRDRRLTDRIRRAV